MYFALAIISNRFHLLVFIDAQISPLCESETTELNEKALLVAEFDVVKAFALDTDNNRICNTFGGTQSNSKLVCVVDFANAGHQLEENCGIFGAIYTESNYTFRCDKNDEEDKNFLIYNEYHFPMCVSQSCGQTGWRTYQENAADSIGSWLEVQGYPDSTCKRLRLEPDFATLPNSVPANCPDDTDAIMEIMNEQTQNLTDHRSAKAIECVSQDGGFNCAIDFSEFDHGFESICEDNKGVYLEVDYTLDCVKSGSTLILTGTNDPFCVSKAFCKPADYATESEDRPQSMISVLSTEGYICNFKNDLVFEDFVRSESPTISAAPTTSAAPSQAPSFSSAPTTTYAPSGAPSLLSCRGATSNLMQNNQNVRQALESIQAEIDTIPVEDYCAGTSGQQFCDFDYTSIDHTLVEDCKAEGGTYIEHTMEVICTQPATGKETVTRYIDRPFCLDDRCETVEMSDFIYDHYRSDIPNPDTICPSYSLQEILIGGRSDIDALPVTTGCRFETNTMSSSVEILNAKNTIKEDYAEFASKEIRNYCPSKVPGFLECDFDLSSGILDIQDNLKSECPNNGGQYLTSAFKVVCYDPADAVEVTFKVKNAPGCVGYCCAPGESKTLLLAEHIWFTDVYAIDKGWNCSAIDITSVSSPNYNINSVCDTAAPGAPPTFPPALSPSGGGGTGDDEDCENHPVWGCYDNLNHPLFDQIFTPQSIPTFAPTPMDLHADNFQRPVVGSDPVTINEKEEGLSGGAVAGIVLGVLLLVGLLFYLLYLLVRNKNADSDDEGEDEERLYNDEERQDRGLDDEDSYDDPEVRSYTTDDWEGDESQYQDDGEGDSEDGEEYTEGGEDDDDT